MKSQETKSMVLLHHHLKALRLPTIGAECEKVALRMSVASFQSAVLATRSPHPSR